MFCYGREDRFYFFFINTKCEITGEGMPHSQRPPVNITKNDTNIDSEKIKNVSGYGGLRWYVLTRFLKSGRL